MSGQASSFTPPASIAAAVLPTSPKPSSRDVTETQLTAPSPDIQQSKTKGTNDAQHYDIDTVNVLFDMMVKAGYGDRKKQKKSLKDVFVEATKLAEKEHGVKRTAKGWQKKFTRMKQEYTAFVAKLSESGRDGDDEGLFDTPEFYERMHELERGKARHDPPAVLCTEDASLISDAPLSSSRKRVKLSHSAVMESFMEKQEQRHSDLIAEIQRGNEEKEKMRNVLERLVDKL